MPVDEQTQTLLRILKVEREQGESSGSVVLSDDEAVEMWSAWDRANPEPKEFKTIGDVILMYQRDESRRKEKGIKTSEYWTETVHWTQPMADAFIAKVETVLQALKKSLGEPVAPHGGGIPSQECKNGLSKLVIAGYGFGDSSILLSIFSNFHSTTGFGETLDAYRHSLLEPAESPLFAP